MPASTASKMPTIDTASIATLNPPNTSPKSPFPYSPDSYTLPKSITKPSNPQSAFLPTNSPTFLVSNTSERPGKPTKKFQVPTSPLPNRVGREINAYAAWVDGQDEEDENEGLIIFPSYHPSFKSSPLMSSPATPEINDLDSLADDESTDDSYTSDSFLGSGSETSSRSSSPSLEGEEFACESWTPCSTPPPSNLPFIFAEDDIAIRNSSQPVNCVDYLAHEWNTDDLFASLKHVRSHPEIRASKRLENALWRTWWRDVKDLKRIWAGRLQWAKESDITWLYGPFQPSETSTLPRITSHPSTKSLLKKHHPAKSMQQRSEYGLALLREATGCRVPFPEPSEKFLSSEIDALGLQIRQKKRVVFNEVVTLYREVVDEPEVLSDEWDSEYSCSDYGDEVDEFGGVD